MSQLQCAREWLYQEKCPKVTTKVTPAFQDIVTKCLKTGSFAVIAVNPATPGADFAGPTDASISS